MDKGADDEDDVNVTNNAPERIDVSAIVLRAGVPVAPGADAQARRAGLNELNLRLHCLHMKNGAPAVAEARGGAQRTAGQRTASWLSGSCGGDDANKDGATTDADDAGDVVGAQDARPAKRLKAALQMVAPRE